MTGEFSPNRCLSIWRLFLAAGLFVGLCAAALAEDKGYVEVKTVSLYEAMKTSLKWHATAYEWNEEGDRPFDNPPARICFWHGESVRNHLCFVAESQGVCYQGVEQISIAQIQRGKEPEYGVLFITRNLSPGIGKKRLVSIWVHHKRDQRFVNVLPAVRLSDLSEFRLVPVAEGGARKVFVAADRIWKDSDGPLYGGAHQFTIEIYEYTEEGLFEFVGEYVTTKRYLTVDLLDDYGVINNELGKIYRSLVPKEKKNGMD